MAALPTGTVTFLFTDIEGSTRLLQHLGDRYADVLTTHHRLLRTAIQDVQGHVVDTQGDALFAAFPRARDALLAAVAAQRAVQAQPWPDGITLRVRMGSHTGEPLSSATGYVGMDVHQAARICAAGHGGQILVSRTTYDLVANDLPPEMSLRDLGEHRLKDLARPQRLYQVLVAGLPADFPALKSLESLINNLPVQLTNFIGREHEQEDVRRLLTTTRLLTLTGPGGAGKTRLALQVAADLLDDFRDGVYFVPLAHVSDAGLVLPAIAQVINVREFAGRPLLESLRDSLRDKQVLLVVDNFEQVLSAAPALTELLAASPRLKILVTTRTALRVYGEREFQVPPLPSPDLRQPPLPACLTEFPAVRLFVERARDVQPGFVVTNDNALAVAEICHRLDGLPLAIELAAARTRSLPPQALLARLERRLPLLTGGARNLPDRQRTLRSTIDWSYELLDRPEQILFRRLAVFSGGCSLDAAEDVGSSDGDLGMDVLNGLESLSAKSMLRQEETAGGEPRFMMLETTREYALERLVQSGEAAAVQLRHADYYVRMAEEAERRIRGPQQGDWFARFDLEQANFTAAIAWSLSPAGSVHGGIERVLRLAGSLSWFWWLLGRYTEARRWLENALAAAKGTPAVETGAWAKVVLWAGFLAWDGGDVVLGRSRFETCLSAFRKLRDAWWTGFALLDRGLGAVGRGDYAAAAADGEESLAIFRALDDPWASACALVALGEVERGKRDDERAIAYYKEAVRLYQKAGDSIFQFMPLANLGYMALRQHDAPRAAALLKQSLALQWRVRINWGVPYALAGLGGVAALTEHPVRAARLFGATEALFGTIGAVMQEMDRRDFERHVATARTKLEPPAFAAAWAEGRAMTLEQAIEYALTTEPG